MTMLLRMDLAMLVVSVPAKLLYCQYYWEEKKKKMAINRTTRRSVNVNVNVNLNVNVNVEETSSHYINMEETSSHCINIEETSSQNSATKNGVQ